MGQVDCSEVAVNANATVPIGRVIPGYNVCLVNDAVQPVPLGCSGQIAVSGRAVATGYLNNKPLTDEKFVSRASSRFLKNAGKPMARWYLTGDTARMDLDGQLTYMGRIEDDSQVKLRGIRIELMEISNSMTPSGFRKGRRTTRRVPIRRRKQLRT